MTETPPAKDLLQQIVSTEVTDFRPRSRKLVAWVLAILTFLVSVSVVVVVLMTHERERELKVDLSSRASVFADSRAKVIETWLHDLGASGAHLAQSDLFRLFATEIDSGKTLGPESALGAQIPYMTTVMTDLTKQEHIVGIYLVQRSGRAILTSAGAPQLTADQRQAAQRAFSTGRKFITPVRASAANELVLDVATPIFPPQSGDRSRPTVTGAILVTTAITARLTQLLAPSALFKPTEDDQLVQIMARKPQVIDPRQVPPIRSLRLGKIPTQLAPLPFSIRDAIIGKNKVFSVGVPVAGVPWLVVHEIDAAHAEATVERYSWSLAGFAALVTAVLAFAFVAVWWRQASEHSRALAIQFYELSSRINAQRRFLDSVLNNIHEMIGLKDKDGTYRYVNKSFENAIGRPADQVVGLDDAALYGYGTAERLALQDHTVIGSGRSVSANEVIYLGGELRHFQISKVPFLNDSGLLSGIVSVARDVTEIVENEKRRQRAMEQMVRALMRTIEAVDPYLIGHAQRVGRFASAVAKRLLLSQGEVLTLEIAATVCQIGKTAIPRQIVAKNERLTDDEFNVMKTHVDHAVSILSSIDFELPVVDVVAQMHERLDGRGYPRGLKGDDIGILGKILGTCDVFCARIEPRSYRHRISPEQALDVLSEHPARYDRHIVEALRAVVSSIEGEKLVATIGDG